MRRIWRIAASQAGLRALAVAVLLSLPACTQTQAQTSNAQVSGLITDSSGAVVAGAQITATNTATNVAYNAVSNESGIYVLPELLPGPYKISVSAQGFGAVNQSGLVLQTGARLSQNFALRPGAVRNHESGQVHGEGSRDQLTS